MMKKQLQTTDTGFKVLEILKFLVKQDASQKELEEKLYELGKKDYAPETLQRYINTLKFVGLEISKSQKTGCYHLENTPFTINPDSDELETLCNLENFVYSLNNHKLSKEFDEFFRHLSRFLPSSKLKEYFEIKLKNPKPDFDHKQLEEKINIFEGYCAQEQKIEIEYEEENGNTDLFKVVPKEILYEQNSIFLFCYITEKAINKKFLLQNIVSHKQLPTKAGNTNFLNTAVFECRGRLAKNYKLKPSERIINSTGKSIIISNSLEDRDVLIRRILKYGENAKILQPKNLVDEIINTIDKMIENIERTEE